MGIEQYKYLATLDERTCETCSPLDGKIFYIKDAVEGVNYPSMHPHCRCTTTFPRNYAARWARDPHSGKGYKIPDMTYSEWIDSLSDEQKAAFEKNVKMYKNRSSDKKQYERYIKVLGKENVPKTFDLFQDLKYTDIAKYEDLKGDYKEKRNSLQERLDYVWNGEKNFIPTGAVMSYAKTIAGAGSKKVLSVEKYLISQYGGSVGEWQKRVGKIESEKYIFDAHWYELDYKQYDAKLKYRGDKF